MSSCNQNCATSYVMDAKNQITVLNNSWSQPNIQQTHMIHTYWRHPFEVLCSLVDYVWIWVKAMESFPRSRLYVVVMIQCVLVTYLCISELLLHTCQHSNCLLGSWSNQVRFKDKVLNQTYISKTSRQIKSENHLGSSVTFQCERTRSPLSERAECNSMPHCSLSWPDLYYKL